MKRERAIVLTTLSIRQRREYRSPTRGLTLAPRISHAFWDCAGIVKHLVQPCWTRGVMVATTHPLIHWMRLWVGPGRNPGMPGHQPPHQHGGQRNTTIILSTYSTYPSYLAARLDGLKTAFGLSQIEAYGKYAKLVENDGDGDESVEIGTTGNVVYLSTGALRETPVELWGNETWNEMSAVAHAPSTPARQSSSASSISRSPPALSASPTNPSRRAEGPRPSELLSRITPTWPPT